ncbi:MAG: hypothetical protein IPL61_38215 [Myxococcales bacterium]|nr:hypothetical protein [Myxococcales bacterium]
MSDGADAPILSRLRRFADRPLKIRQLATFLGAEPAVAVAAVVALLARAAVGDDDPEVLAAVGCLPQALAELEYPVRVALYDAGHAAGATAFQRLILNASPPTASGRELDRQLRPERPLRNRGRPLTLGERKALARRPRGDALTELLRDPHPDVVAILLDNPQLTEPEVVRVAATRPAVPAALVLVAEHRRWSTRAGVRRALALNPHTPVHVALRLVVTLAPADWAAIVASSELTDAVRASARELLGRRRGRP